MRYRLVKELCVYHLIKVYSLYIRCLYIVDTFLWTTWITPCIIIDILLNCRCSRTVYDNVGFMPKKSPQKCGFFFLCYTFKCSRKGLIRISNWRVTDIKHLKLYNMWCFLFLIHIFYIACFLFCYILDYSRIGYLGQSSEHITVISPKGLHGICSLD